MHYRVLMMRNYPNNNTYRIKE